MASIILSQLICTIALITLITILPIYYSNVQDDIRTSVMKIEFKEIADYISSTIANTYYLVNNTDCLNFNLTKTLVYLPETVQNSFFIIQIEGNSTAATSITVYAKDRPSIQSNAWLATGLKGGDIPSIESGKGHVLAGCYRNSTGVYVTFRLMEASV